jgi:hypothetical protein
MIIIYAADIGSVKKENFAWSRLVYDIDQIHSDTSIENLVDSINDDIAQDNYVCLGFECPLFINLPSDPGSLTSARAGEGSRAWSARAGSGSLTTGLPEVLWVFSELKRKSKKLITATFIIESLLKNSANLLIWEAFVSSKAKGNTHIEDSIIAVRKFAERLQCGTLQTDISVENPFSLVGASLLRSEISNDIGILKNQCLVLKA